MLVRILERGKRAVGTTLRVAPADAWILHGVVEGAAGVVEDLAHVNPAGDQVVAGGLDAVHGEEQAVRRARLGRRDSFSEDDRGCRARRSELHHSEVFMGVVDVFTKPQCRVKALGTINVGDGDTTTSSFISTSGRARTRARNGKIASGPASSTIAGVGLVSDQCSRQSWRRLDFARLAALIFSRFRSGDA